MRSLLSVQVVLIAMGSALGDTEAQEPTTIQILAAKKAEVIKSPFGNYAPTNKADDVMLLLKVRGLARLELDKLPEDRRYVLAGERKCELMYTLDSETGESELAFAVPKGETELKLILGDRPPVTIRAKPTIVQELVSPLRTK